MHIQRQRLSLFVEDVTFQVFPLFRNATMKWNNQIFTLVFRCKNILLPANLPISYIAFSKFDSCFRYHHTFQYIKQCSYLFSASNDSLSQGKSWTSTIRGYAKGKDKKKTDKGKKHVDINETQLAEVVKLDTLKGQMQKAVDHLKEDYIKNLSLRSTTGSIESLPISLDGSEYTLQELAQIVRKNPKTIVINMAVFPQAIPAALKAIQNSGMNLNPQQDATTIFIPVPKVTKEHRENLAKNAKTLFIKCKDSIKDTQNKFLKIVKTNTEISIDMSHDVQNQIVSMADQYVSTAEKIMEGKQLELLGKD